MVLRAVLLLVVLVSCTAVTGKSNEDSTSFEKFFDAVIKGIVKKKHDLIEPFHAEDLLIVLQPEIRSHKLPPKLNVKVTNVTVNGLSTIHRSGHAKVELKKDSRVTSAQIAVGPLHATANLEVSLFSLRLKRRNPKLTVDVSDFDISIEIFGNKTAQVLRTENFKINKLDGLKVAVTASILTDKIENKIINWILPRLEKKIRTDVEQVVRGQLDEKLQQLPDELKKLLYG